MFRELKSEHLMSMQLNVAFDRARQIGAVPLGRRGIYPVDGGRFEGTRLKGRVLGDGIDWVTWRSDRAMVIDVRLALETDDGALIAMSYVGLSYQRTDEARAAVRQGDLVAYEDTYVRTTPRFETSDPRYEWLNRVIAVANGHRGSEGAMYEVFEIV
jgi:hypothetical protein